MVVIGAPVLEEFGFRLWLSGKKEHVVAALLGVSGAFALWVLHTSHAALGVGAFMIGVLGAGLALLLLPGKPPMDGFGKAFPAFFWLATLSFALIHIANFEVGNSPISLVAILPLVLPQLILGTMLGYVRVRFALWAAIALHAAHNASVLALAGLVGQLP